MSKALWRSLAAVQVVEKIVLTILREVILPWHGAKNHSNSDVQVSQLPICIEICSIYLLLYVLLTVPPYPVIGINCGQPPPVINASVSVNTTDLFSIAQYTCSDGYELSGGLEYAVCWWNGMWYQENISCNSIRMYIDL